MRTVASSRIYIVFAALLLSGLVACSSNAETVEVHFRKKDGSVTPSVTAEIAKTPGEIQLGLMYRKEMDADQGMIFLFNSDKPRSFWMKNTYLELDMVFVNSKHKVVSITKRAVPLSETARKSEAPAKYVVEVIGGSSEKWGLSKGDEMVLSKDL